MKIEILFRWIAITVLSGFFNLTIADELNNWPSWRGHGGNGVSQTAKPPIEWSETKNIKWKVEIPGQGSASPVIWEEQVFVVSAVKMGEPKETQPESKQRRRSKGNRVSELSFQLFCFDRQTGKLNWKKTAVETTPHEGIHSTNSFASASPFTDGQHVYAYFGSRGLFCYTMAGELVWSKTDFGKMNTRGGFGEGSSPTLAGDKIIVPWDHEGPSALFALNKLTGEQLWRVDRDEPSCWASPYIIDNQVIMNGQNKARGYNIETGQELWQCGGQTMRPVACPVSLDDLVIIGSGMRGAYMGAFRYKQAKGDISNTESVAWQLHDDTPDIASPVLSNGRIYFYKAKTGILTCVDAKTGKNHFGPERIPGVNSTYASPVAANGYLYLTDRDGTTVTIKDSDTLEIVATSTVGEAVDSTPAPVGNQLFIKGVKHLFCIAKE